MICGVLFRTFSIGNAAAQKRKTLLIKLFVKLFAFGLKLPDIGVDQFILLGFAKNFFNISVSRRVYAQPHFVFIVEKAVRHYSVGRLVEMVVDFVPSAVFFLKEFFRFLAVVVTVEMNFDFACYYCIFGHNVGFVTKLRK